MVFEHPDDQMSAVVSIVAGMAILIACMGLFGLAAITAEKRLKELGIRKTLGASVGQLVFATSRSFGLLVLVAFVLRLGSTVVLQRSVGFPSLQKLLFSTIIGYYNESIGLHFSPPRSRGKGAFSQ